MKKTARVLFVLLAAFVGFVFWAKSPLLSPEKMPPEGIVRLFDSPADFALPEELKIVTYNIGYASGDKNNRAVSLSRAEVEGNLNAMAKALEPLHADIVCLQEVDFHSARTFDINQMEFLGKALNLPYAAYVVTWNKRYLPWPYWPLQYQFGHIVSGQAVLSRFPLEKIETLKFEKPASNPFWYNWFYLDRIVEKVGVKIGEKTLALWNVHLEAFDAPTRLSQAERLARWIAENPSPLKLAAGDFNSVSIHRDDLEEGQKKELEDTGASIYLISEKTGLKNAETFPPFYTMPSWDPIKKIDHILYDEKVMNLLRVDTLKGLKASDHLPVWAAFKWKEKQP
ncbi:MAG: endonuclease/exonuclease/phosphatase family protein [bacterium]